MSGEALKRTLPAPREDFPILSQGRGRYPLAYLDSAATAQKPRAVIEALTSFYQEDNANIHRAVYQLGERATARYEAAREQVQAFINARHSREVIFVRGATEAINLVASGLAQRLKTGDEVLITALEHHANIVPWQLACQRSGARLRVVPLNERCDLDLEQARAMISERTKVFAFSQISNALGVVNPVEELIEMARDHGALTLVDGAQGAAHAPVDVEALGCDFYVFSGHKLYGPTGVGVLYGRLEALESLPPYQGGGDMIDTVTFEESSYAELPSRLEAGTPNIAGVVGLGVALDYLKSFELREVEAYEEALVTRLAAGLAELEGVRVLGQPDKRASAVSFVVEGQHPQDLAMLLDQYGVAVRVGHHCAQPLMGLLGLTGTIRASVGIYTTHEDIEQLLTALPKAIMMLS